ncbi:phosphodiester glycosidase family protein [Flammeovirga sp. SJP92]|uniref:phosphodiester glycosidase family protein n=1 Tax=Flammeovirga sp. SJP92 TaxID=1775430 RepID=UPI00078791A2|nr:phosphodiester glycosidase family protein [Flammeovirga sp. SJP92]KXX66679.1 hypothetical protein AVL50_31040 [Flammeovirga sp. SJP92]
MNKLFITFILVFGFSSVFAQSFFQKVINGNLYYVYQLNAENKVETIKMFWKNEQGKALKSLANIEKSYPNQEVLFSMNAGIFNPALAPEGLYIENGKTYRPLNQKKGKGNFYMEPNGIFLVDKMQKTAIIKSTHWETEERQSNVSYAVQSGPLLLYKGIINPKFSTASKSRFIRNAVGVDADGTTYFVCSKNPVTFYELSSFFRDELACKNALYLDGAISNMKVGHQYIHSSKSAFASMIAVVRNKEHQPANFTQYTFPLEAQIKLEESNEFNRIGAFWGVFLKHNKQLQLVGNYQSSERSTVLMEDGHVVDSALLKRGQVIVAKEATGRYHLLFSEDWEYLSKVNIQNAVAFEDLLFSKQFNINNVKADPLYQKAIVLGLDEKQQLKILECHLKSGYFSRSTLIYNLKALGLQDGILISYDENAQLCIPNRVYNWNVTISKTIQQFIIIQ